MDKGIKGVYQRLAANAISDTVLNMPVVASAVRIDDSKPYVIVDGPDSDNYSPSPYGALPAIKNASREELLDMAAKCSAAKYWYTNKGDYYRAWKAAWRERLIERILEGITYIGLAN